MTGRPARGRYLDQHIRPHYIDVLLPLIQSYEEAPERELRERADVSSEVAF